MKRLLASSSLLVPLLVIPAWLHAQDVKEAPEQELSKPTTEAEPMQPLAFLAGGQWHNLKDEPKPSFHLFEWALDGRVLGSRTLMRDDLRLPTASQAWFFHHPADKSLRSLAIAEGGILTEGRFHMQKTPDGRPRLVHDFHYYQGAGKANYISHWDLDGRDAYHWDLYIKTPSGVTLAFETDFARRTEELVELPELGEMRGEPRELAPLSWLVGEWIGSAQLHEQEPFRMRVVYKWAASHQMLMGSSWLLNEDGSRPQVSQSWIYWHPEKKQIIYTGLTSDGGVEEGPVRPGDERTIWSFQQTAPDGKTLTLHEETVLEGKQKSTLQATAWIVEGDERKPHLTATITRQ